MNKHTPPFLNIHIRNKCMQLQHKNTIVNVGLKIANVYEICVNIK
jgi:hypothetical protein